MAEDKPHYSGEKGRPANTICLVMGVMASIFAALTLFVAAFAWYHTQVEFIYPFLAIWVLAPPVWFWFEYFFLYRRYW